MEAISQRFEVRLGVRWIDAGRNTKNRRIGAAPSRNCGDCYIKTFNYEDFHFSYLKVSIRSNLPL